MARYPNRTYTVVDTEKITEDELAQLTDAAIESHVGTLKLSDDGGNSNRAILKFFKVSTDAGFIDPPILDDYAGAFIFRGSWEDMQIRLSADTDKFSHDKERHQLTVKFKDGKSAKADKLKERKDQKDEDKGK